MLRKQHPAKTSFQERLGSHLGAPKIGPEGGPKTNKKLEQISCSFLPPLKTDNPPRWRGARGSAHLGFGAFFLEIAAGASAGCKIRGSRVSGGHSWGWGEKLKLLQQQASLLFKAPHAERGRDHTTARPVGRRISALKFQCFDLDSNFKTEIT